MKKLAMCLMGAAMVLSLSACTPTTQQNTNQNIDEIVAQMATGSADDKVPDPDAPELEIVSVYRINDNGLGLVREMDGVETLDAQSVVDKLIEYGVLDEGTEVISFDTEGEQEENAGPGAADSTSTSAQLGVLNLSQVPESADAEAEQVLLAAIGNTFTENFGLEQLKLQVNGANYGSQGDEDYLTYIVEYDMIDVQQ